MHYIFGYYIIFTGQKMSKMSLQPNGAIIRASSVNACDAAESCLPAGNVSAALPHEEFFLEQVAGEGMSADGIIPLFSRGVSVLLFSRGKAEVRINGKSYSADAGTVATVMADEIVELEHVSEDCVCAMVSAPSETVIADRDNVFRWEIMKSIFYSMMLEICDAYRQYGTVVGKSELLRHEQLGDELFRLLSRHCRTHRSVSFYAGKLNITPKYLSREIKRITGRTVQEWVNRLTIMEMKKQLNVPGRTIMQISEDMEFSSPSAFVQFFKLHTGTTPLKYRKSAR